MSAPPDTVREELLAIMAEHGPVTRVQLGQMSELPEDARQISNALHAMKVAGLVEFQGTQGDRNGTWALSKLGREKTACLNVARRIRQGWPDDQDRIIFPKREAAGAAGDLAPSPPPGSDRRADDLLPLFERAVRQAQDAIDDFVMQVMPDNQRILLEHLARARDEARDALDRLRAIVAGG